MGIGGDLMLNFPDRRAACAGDTRGTFLLSLQEHLERTLGLVAHWPGSEDVPDGLVQPVVQS